MTEYALIKDNEIVQIGQLPTNFENVTRFDLAEHKTLKRYGWVPVLRTSVKLEDGFDLEEDITINEDDVTVVERLVPYVGNKLQNYLDNKANEYKTLRANEYPNMRDYIDGIVKGDEKQVQIYIDACLAVKAKYPKPE